MASSTETGILSTVGDDIKISDSEEITSKKIMTAITDRSRLRKNDPGHPDECEVVYKYWKIFGNAEEIENIACECKAGARGCADCKRLLAAKVNERMSEIRELRKYYEKHPDEVKQIIEEGSAKERFEAGKIISNVRNIIKMY